METLRELVQFLHPSQRIDLKDLALTHVLSLTGTEEGVSVILGFDEILHAIFRLTEDTNQTIAKDAILIFINLTAKAPGAIKLYEAAKELTPTFRLVSKAVAEITNENSDLADPWLMVLSNLTRVETMVHSVLNEIDGDDGKTLLQLAKAFAKLDYNKKKQKLHYLGPFFCNLTQVSRGRELFCQSRYNIFDKIIPFASYQDSLIRRGGTIGIFRNICFDPIYHDLILNDREDILSAILMPLCGPEEFTDEENEKFPLELQFLPESKQREDDPDLRQMLLECLLQLSATKRYRELLRNKGVYEILREYHKWEAKVGKNKDCLLACENVVDILIKKEEEIGFDNYKQVEVPEEVVQKFIKEDAEYLKDLL